MRRMYSTSLILLFVGIFVAGSGLAFSSTLTFRIGAFAALVGVIGVLAYAFRPKSSEQRR